MTKPNRTSYDAVIIGAGMYGCAIACHLVEHFKYQHVLVVEREGQLMQRASYVNQARVHNGYHYPRSYTTAYRSRINLPQFVKDWPSAIEKNFTKTYALAKQNSKVTAKQFVRFCNEIGASISPAAQPIKNLFNHRLIEDVYEVEEYAFSSTELARLSQQNLDNCGVEVLFDTTVTGIQQDQSRLSVLATTKHDEQIYVSANKVFNCSYSGLNAIKGDFNGTETHLKHEITEMALLSPPKVLSDLAFTIMDGPFFSFMPFPSRQLYTLSHVRYTPHYSFRDSPDTSPYEVLENYHKESRANRMLRDAARYLPAISEATYAESLFEIKTVLVKNETDDGRPILFEESLELPGLYSVLGGKIDNIYDILERMETCITPK